VLEWQANQYSKNHLCSCQQGTDRSLKLYTIQVFVSYDFFFLQKGNELSNGSNFKLTCVLQIVLHTLKYMFFMVMCTPVCFHDSFIPVLCDGKEVGAQTLGNIS